MKRWTTAVACMALLLAGCTTPSEAPPEAQQQPVLQLGDRPDTTFTDIQTGPAVAPDLNATTVAAPELIPGEWWRIRYQTSFSDELVEVVRVVAEVDDAGYIIGMPHEGWLKEAISFHSPAFGDVNFDLSYNTHNELFSPVQFPLEAGKTWDTSFAATPYEATVESADDYTATIRFMPTGEPDPITQVMIATGSFPEDTGMVLTYDARQHEVVRMESSIGSWEVVEHGYGFEGWVTVPRGEDTAIDYGTFGPASETHSPAERTLTVDGGFNRMTMMHFVGTLGDAPGSVQARDVTPLEEEWITSLTGAGFSLQFFETNGPDGEWTVQDTVAGAGFTYHMGIAYFQYDIHLPSGDRRADHGHAVIR